jgi:hypothetical protein
MKREKILEKLFTSINQVMFSFNKTAQYTINPVRQRQINRENLFYDFALTAYALKIRDYNMIYKYREARSFLSEKYVYFYLKELFNREQLNLNLELCNLETKKIKVEILVPNPGYEKYLYLSFRVNERIIVPTLFPLSSRNFFPATNPFKITKIKVKSSQEKERIEHNNRALMLLTAFLNSANVENSTIEEINNHLINFACRVNSADVCLFYGSMIMKEQNENNNGEGLCCVFFEM